MAVSKAVKLLDRLLDAGYPEGTAKKIASGELPMDEASRMARAREQGFTDTAYHTGTMETVNQLRSDRPFFAAAEPAVAASYSKSPMGNPKAAYKVMINPSNNAVIDSEVSEYTYVLPEGGVMQLPSGDVMAERDIMAARPDLAFDNELEYFSTADAADLASDQGASGVTFKNLVDLSHSGLYEAVAKDTSGKPLMKQYEEGSTIYAQTDPSTVRLEKAAFDPENIGLPYLMGGSAALAVGLGASDDSQAAAAEQRMSPEFATRMFDRIIAENTGKEKNAYIPVKPTTMDYVQNAGRAIVDYFGTDPGKDMLGGLGQEIAVEGALGSLGQMIFGPAGAVGFASFMPNVAGDPTMDMLNDQGQPMTEAEFAAYRRQLRGN